MAISMVRQPSETPNVTNIDDIIPFRYAYGDQNGYVIGKGQELSYTINGRDFRVNSGRVVLSGVESDVDANGVTFTIDNASETRYYVVYYQVNLATNTTNILLSNFSTTGYPIIDIGEDLTVNPSGIARMELYRFTTSNGVIGNVEKTVKSIDYKDAIKKDDGTYAGFNEDSNGILRNADKIVPQRIKLWEDSTPAISGNTIVFNENIVIGDTIEIYYAIDGWTAPISFRFKFLRDSMGISDRYSSCGKQLGVYYDRNWDSYFTLTKTTLTINEGVMLWYAIPSSEGGTITLNTCNPHTYTRIYAVYKVIE